MSSFAVGLQSFPSVAWVPFAILLIGLNDFGGYCSCYNEFGFFRDNVTYSGVRIYTEYLHNRRPARNMGAKGFSLFCTL